MPAAPQVSKEMSGKSLAGEVWALQQGDGPMISFTLIFDGSVMGFLKRSEQHC